MPTPEQKPVTSSAEQTSEKSPQVSFEEEIRRLIEPQRKINDKGKEVTEAPVIGNKYVLELARQALSFAGKSPEGITALISEGNKLCLSREIGEEDGGWAEWGELVTRLVNHRNFLLRREKEGKVNQKTMSPEIRLSGLDELMERMRDLQEKTIRSAKENQESAANLISMFIAYSERAREAYSQLPPGEEKERWVDVELQQDFYARFTPNVEPKFYTMLSSEERREWDARWQLARAAFWKRINSADVEKLAQNPDLIELTTEQMERLYKIEGVKEGLEWYTEAILKRIEIYEEWDEETGEPIGQTTKKSLVECRSGRDFEIFRKNLQYFLKREVFGVTKEEEESLAKRVKEGDEKAEEQIRDLRVRVKSTDAIAWNWMWVSNLIESVDSRYSRGLGEDALRERHGTMPPAICSDDLRAVFHPQEKFEDKASKGQEWGAFGKWGVLQIERIKKETGKEAEDFIFEGASSPSQFWHYEVKKKGKILIYVPECYPVTTMKSFWETCVDKDKKRGKASLLQRIEGKQEINWESVDTDPWKTNYLTVVLNKANKLVEYFNPGVPLEEGKIREWTRPLLDIFVRLKLEPELREENERLLNEKQFHNLKVWAVYAGRGGLRKPASRTPVPPFKTEDKMVLQSLLRDYEVGFLERGIFGSLSGEKLDII